MKTITISTRKNDEVVDITETIETHLREAPTENGLCFLLSHIPPALSPRQTLTRVPTLIS